jgi:hypothetical protein
MRTYKGHEYNILVNGDRTDYSFGVPVYEDDAIKLANQVSCHFGHKWCDKCVLDGRNIIDINELSLHDRLCLEFPIVLADDEVLVVTGKIPDITYTGKTPFIYKDNEE